MRVRVWRQFALHFTSLHCACACGGSSSRWRWASTSRRPTLSHRCQSASTRPSNRRADAHATAVEPPVRVSRHQQPGPRPSGPAPRKPPLRGKSSTMQRLRREPWHGRRLVPPCFSVYDARRTNIGRSDLWRPTSDDVGGTPAGPRARPLVPGGINQVLEPPRTNPPHAPPNAACPTRPLTQKRTPV